MRPKKERSGQRSRRATFGLEDAHGGCGIFLQLRSGTNGARDKIAAAVRTDAPQTRLNAITTKSALVSADHGFRRVRRQILVAALAVGAQLQHGNLTDRD